jgi:cytochrome P450
VASETVEVVPAHISKDVVRDFDFNHVPGAEEDVYLAWKQLQDGPEIFWTPHYGGHWVVTRADDVEMVQKDHERFSHEVMTLPRNAKPIRTPPIQYDPPEHGGYRAILNRAFSPKVVAGLEQDVRDLAINLIEGFEQKGECEFVSDFARHLPIVIFLRMVDLPMEHREMFLEWAEAAVRSPDLHAKRAAYQHAIDYLSKVIEQRTANPGDDLISMVIAGKIEGRPLNHDEVLGMCTLLFVGGLDTVAGMISFIAMFLAKNPAHRKQLINTPEILPQAIEELLRRHGMSNTVRLITRDMEHKGLQFKKGEFIMVPISLHGMDDTKWANPLTVDFSRNTREHATFGNGPHRCPGAGLARAEIRAFLQEWLKRIPDFEIKAGEKVQTATGSVNGVERMVLSWTPRKR